MRFKNAPLKLRSKFYFKQKYCSKTVNENEKIIKESELNKTAEVDTQTAGDHGS